MEFFSNNKKYKRHYREQHSEIMQKFICKLCKSEFKRKEGLKRHYIAKHLDMKYNCRMCHSRYTEKCRLKEHYREQHGLPYCTKCEYIFIDFVDNKNINNSDKIITEIWDHVPPHDCMTTMFCCTYQDCNKSYKRKQYLDKHIQNNHYQQMNRNSNN